MEKSNGILVKSWRATSTNYSIWKKNSITFRLPREIGQSRNASRCTFSLMHNIMDFIQTNKGHRCIFKIEVTDLYAKVQLILPLILKGSKNTSKDNYSISVI